MNYRGNYFRADSGNSILPLSHTLIFLTTKILFGVGSIFSGIHYTHYITIRRFNSSESPSSEAIR